MFQIQSASQAKKTREKTQNNIRLHYLSNNIFIIHKIIHVTPVDLYFFLINWLSNQERYSIMTFLI